MWMLACPQNLFWRGMMSSKDPKIILTVKIFADKQTKFRCQTFLTCLWVYWGNSQLQIVPLLSLISVIKSQSRVSVHCSAIKQHSLSLITVSCYHSPSWHPRILDTVLQLLLTPALADTCVVWNIDVNILWRRQIKFIVCIFQSNSRALGYGRKVAAALKSLQRQTRMILSVPLSDHISRLLINDM